MIRNLTAVEWAALWAAADDHRQHLLDNGQDPRLGRELAALNRAMEKVQQLAPAG